MGAQVTARAAGELTPLVRLFRAHWRPLLLSYALYNVDNVLNLAYPLVLGLANNGLIRSESGGVALLVGQHLAHLFVGTARQMYDTRAFTAIYTDTVTRLVCRQRDAGVGVSTVAARSVLSRELVDLIPGSPSRMVNDGRRRWPMMAASAGRKAGSRII